MRSAFRPLRHAFVFPTIERAIADANGKAPGAFRVVHFSVQVDHVHLIVEAVDKAALSSGMRGLAIRVARNVNQLVVRKGRVWADRWHGRELASPREVRAAIRYVLANFRKYDPRSREAVDQFSSAIYFNGFRELGGRAPIEVAPSFTRRTLVPPPRPADARTWLLRVGWLRGGGLSLFEAPGVLGR